MASEIVFLSRNNAFESERRVTLTLEGVLRIVDANGETHIPLHELGLIELSAESSHAYDIAFTCQLYRRRSWFPALTLKSKLYQGPNSFSNRRGDYRQLMVALHGHIVKNAWPIKTQIAARPAALMWGLYAYAHWAVLIWIAVFITAVLGLAALEPAWSSLIPEISFGLACAATLAFLASKIAGIRAAYGPWPYDPRSIPAAYLPALLAG